MKCVPFAIIAMASLASCSAPPPTPLGNAANEAPTNVAVTPAADPVPAPAAPAPAAPNVLAAPVPASGLGKTRWSVTAINGRATSGGPGYYVAFDKWEKGGITAGFGCNNFQGTYALNGDHLSSGPLTGTEMACGDPEMAFERQGSAVLSSNVRVERIRGDRIRLVSEAGSIDLKRTT